MTIRRSAPLWAGAIVLLALPAFAQFSVRDTPQNQTVQTPQSQTVQLPSQPSTSNVLPEGTHFIVRMDDKLDTAKVKPGKKFTMKLAEALVAPNGATIPAGKKIHGHVSSVNRGLHSRMLLSFDEIETNHGWAPLVATLTDVPGEHGLKQPGSEGEMEKKGVDKRRAIESAAVGAAVGAAAGAAAGGGRGAAIGAGAGGALGTGAGILTDRDFTLNKGQQVELRLDRDLRVP